MQECFALKLAYWEDGVLEILPPGHVTTLPLSFTCEGVSCICSLSPAVQKRRELFWLHVCQQILSRCYIYVVVFIHSFNILFTPFGSMCSLQTWKKEISSVLKSTTLIHVPVLKQDQPWRSDASLSQQLACPRFYLRIRSSPLYLAADVGRPLLLHDGSCRPLEAEHCWFEYWWKSFFAF